MVGEIDQELAAYMIYELHPNRLHLLNFAVAPKYRRSGVGTSMLNKLASKLSCERRNRILTEVRETNVAAQLFFKANGYRAISVLKDLYYDSDEDAYLFQLRKPCFAE